MKVKLVFLGWRQRGKSIDTTEKGVELSMGDFHGGTTFTATIDLDSNNAQELLASIKEGYQPCWWMTVDDTAPAEGRP